MCSIIKDEFQLRHMWLNHKRPHTFYTSQWKCPRLLFVIFRLLTAGYTIFGLAFMLIDYARWRKEFLLKYHVMAFLTTWTYIVQCIHFVFSAAIAIWNFKKHPGNANSHKDFVELNVSMTSSESVSMRRVIPAGESEKGQNENIGVSIEEHDDSLMLQENSVANTYDQHHMEYSAAIANDIAVKVSSDSAADQVDMAWYLKISWLVSDVISVWAIIITVVYFAIIYPIPSPSFRGGLSDINVHALNSVLVLLDVIVSARPVRLLHAVYPLMYGLLYVQFTVIYWATDHTNVLYYVLDYNKPQIAVAYICGLGLVVIPVVQSLQFGIYALRLYIYMKVYGEKF